MTVASVASSQLDEQPEVEFEDEAGRQSRVPPPLLECRVATFVAPVTASTWCFSREADSWEE